MKRILLVSYLFAPNNEIGAIRPSKIAEALLKKGYFVDVFTYGYTSNDTLNFSCTGIAKYLENENPCIDSATPPRIKAFKKDRVLFSQAKRHYWALLRAKKDRSFVKRLKHIYKEVLCQNQYDVVISSFGPIGSLQGGLWLKKQQPNIKWICDFRDPVLVSMTPWLCRPYYKHIQEKACKKADAIVAVSNGYLKRICKGRYANKSFMIPNGYDLADKSNVDVLPTCESLRLVYAGAMYQGKRDLAPVFQAIMELSHEKKVDISKVVFEYAGTEFSVVRSQAEKYGMAEILKDNGRMARKPCLDLQSSSHALILSTWNETGEEGVFPGKFLEYMLIGRPIISVVDGNLANSEVTQVMREGNLGVSYEAANASEDFATLKEFIYRLYKDTIYGDGFEFVPNKAVLERYNYDNIIKQIEALINKDE